MTVYSIQRDEGPNISIVRIVTDSPLEDVLATGWLLTQADSIAAVNNGPFEWSINDVVLVSYPQNQSIPYPTGIQSKAMFYIFPGLDSLNPIVPIYPNIQAFSAHAGGGQALADELPLGINIVNVVASDHDSVKLPQDVLGQTVIVTNTSTKILDIYPFLGDNINNLGTNVPFSLSPQVTVMFVGVTAVDWRTTSSSTYANTQGLTAHAGGGQSLATQLNLGINVVTVSAIAGDSVKLPTSVLGQTVIVQNGGAAATNVFPATGNFINELAVNTAISVPVAGRAIFIGTQPTAWVSFIQP